MDSLVAFALPAATSSFVGKRATGASTCGVSRPQVRMMAEKEDEKAAAPKPKRGIKLPVASGKPKAASKPAGDEEEEGDFNTTKKRGLGLLVEDLQKNLPEISGVGRQDVTGYMKPQFGEPGYKTQAYETVEVSKLGISPFADDANYTSKVGGLDAVKKAAKDVIEGKKAEDIKKAVLKKEAVVEEAPKVYPLPDYLMPLPEDTPRRGMSWVNYITPPS